VEIPEPQHIINSRMVEEQARLFHLEQARDKKALERDLTDIFVGYLNSRCRLSLKWICSPDETEHRSSEPDHVYADTAMALSVALEVTRLYDEKQKRWEDFSRRVAKALGPEARGYFGIGIPHCLAVPPGKDLPARVAQELAVLKPGERTDLTSLLGGPVSAERLSMHWETLVVLPLFHEVPHFIFGPKYQNNLREANDKFRRWHDNGSETFLLYDARMWGALTTTTVRGKWNRVAHMFNSNCPSGIVPEDYSNIDHVIVFGLCAKGVEAKTLWTHSECRLPTARIPTE